MRIEISSSGRRFQIFMNKARKTFTIKEGYIKFRTLPMSKQEFEDAQYWNGNDCVNFLKTDNYILI